ncbi:MAG: Maf family protein [bacterium]|nr:Maf family protein [Candidatus Sumerlaeota bacterium]
MTKPAAPRRIVLASASPRRRELVASLGMQCEFASPDVDESSIPFKVPRELALKAAFAKAVAVEPDYPNSLIVAADTIVTMNGRVYMKPEDEADACRMLSELSGRTHTVISGVAVKESGKAMLLDAVETRVHIRQIEPDEIAEYVATREPLDKAGAYAAQGMGQKFIQQIEGDYYNVVGLPLEKLLMMMSLFLDVTAYRLKLKSLAGRVI